MDFYKILRVNPKASEQQIRDAADRLLRVWNPDNFEVLHTIAQKVFDDITIAKAVLLNPVERDSYDKIRESRPEESAEVVIDNESGRSVRYSRPWVIDDSKQQDSKNNVTHCFESRFNASSSTVPEDGYQTTDKKNYNEEKKADLNAIHNCLSALLSKIRAPENDSNYQGKTVENFPFSNSTIDENGLHIKAPELNNTGTSTSSTTYHETKGLLEDHGRKRLDFEEPQRVYSGVLSDDVIYDISLRIDRDGELQRLEKEQTMLCSSLSDSIIYLRNLQSKYFEKVARSEESKRYFNDSSSNSSIYEKSLRVDNDRKDQGLENNQTLLSGSSSDNIIYNKCSEVYKKGEVNFLSKTDGKSYGERGINEEHFENENVKHFPHMTAPKLNKNNVKLIGSQNNISSSQFLKKKPADYKISGDIYMKRSKETDDLGCWLSDGNSSIHDPSQIRQDIEATYNLRSYGENNDNYGLIKNGKSSKKNGNRKVENSNFFKRKEKCEPLNANLKNIVSGELLAFEENKNIFPNKSSIEKFMSSDIQGNKECSNDRKDTVKNYSYVPGITLLSDPAETPSLKDDIIYNSVLDANLIPQHQQKISTSSNNLPKVPSFKHEILPFNQGESENSLTSKNKEEGISLKNPADSIPITVMLEQVIGEYNYENKDSEGSEERISGIITSKSAKSNSECHPEQISKASNSRSSSKLFYNDAIDDEDQRKPSTSRIQPHYDDDKRKFTKDARKNIEELKPDRQRNYKSQEILQDISDVNVRNTRIVQIKENLILKSTTWLEISGGSNIDVSKLKAVSRSNYTEDSKWQIAASVICLKCLEMVSIYRFNAEEDHLSVFFEGNLVCRIINDEPEEISTEYWEPPGNIDNPLTMSVIMKMNNNVLKIIRNRENKTEQIQIFKNDILLYTLENRMDEE